MLSEQEKSHLLSSTFQLLFLLGSKFSPEPSPSSFSSSIWAEVFLWWASISWRKLATLPLFSQAARMAPYQWRVLGIELWQIGACRFLSKCGFSIYNQCDLWMVLSCFGTCKKHNGKDRKNTHRIVKFCNWASVLIHVRLVVNHQG